MISLNLWLFPSNSNELCQWFFSSILIYAISRFIDPILFGLKLLHRMEYYPHFAVPHIVQCTNQFILIGSNRSVIYNFCQHKHHIWFLYDFCFCTSIKYRMSISKYMSCKFKLATAFHAQHLQRAPNMHSLFALEANVILLFNPFIVMLPTYIVEIK